MNDQELFMRYYMKHNFYTSCIGKITEIMENRKVKIELVSANEDELKAPLVLVPVLRLANSSQAIKIGDVVPVYFSKFAIDEFIDTLSNVTLEDVVHDLEFDRENAYALPMIFDDMINTPFPEIFTFHEPVKMEKTLEVDGSVIFNDTLKVMKKVNFEDELEVQKLIKSLEDVMAVSVSLLKHIHINTKPGSPTDFSGIPKP